jgi:predicted nucleotidyltransferase component of viral defense system
MEIGRTPMIRPHEDRELFRRSINFTVAETTFQSRLVEKDYFCTVVLQFLGGTPGLVFKGGTCLAKVHTGFYRLSEDLDFVIPMPIDSKRKERSSAIDPAKKAFKKLTSGTTVFRQKEALKGANNSTQYIGVLEYDSFLSDGTESIKFEISLREPLLDPTLSLEARTILLSASTSKQTVDPFGVISISRREAYAEKFRAALTRSEPAIRDYFDIDYAVTRMNLNPAEEDMISLVRKKLAVPGNDIQELSEDRQRALRLQLETELKPVLRSADYEKFDLTRAISFVNEMKKRSTV